MGRQGTTAHAVAIVPYLLRQYRHDNGGSTRRDRDRAKGNVSDKTTALDCDKCNGQYLVVSQNIGMLRSQFRLP